MLKTAIKKILQTPDKIEEKLIKTAPLIHKMAPRDIEKLYARLFSSEDGQKVLTHLQLTIFQRSFGAGASDAQLRHAEGKRAAMAEILRLVNRGRQSA